jgi:hypothetical protein
MVSVFRISDMFLMEAILEVKDSIESLSTFTTIS